VNPDEVEMVPQRRKPRDRLKWESGHNKPNMRSVGVRLHCPGDSKHVMLTAWLQNPPWPQVEHPNVYIGSQPPPGTNAHCSWEYETNDRDKSNIHTVLVLRCNLCGTRERVNVARLTGILEAMRSKVPDQNGHMIPTTWPKLIVYSVSLG
jgi:hypothetical protein